MDRVITKCQSIPLDYSDIQAICQGDVHLEEYFDLKDCNDIMDLFKKSNVCILFYSVSDQNTGHYSTLILHRDTNTLEHFDSYGFGIQEVLKRSTFDFKRSGGLNFAMRLITKAIAQYGIRFQENKICFQKDTIPSGHGVSTCGIYGSLRARFENLSLVQFQNLLTDQRMSADQLVTYMTILFTENKQMLDR